MQSINVFYYPNAVDVQWNNDPTLTLRNRVMYQRTVKLYKGVDNVIRFTFKNQDQHVVNITGWDVTFNLISDDEGSIIVRKPVTVIDANVGVVTATITELDLIDLNNEFYNYSLSITDPYGSEQVVYTDDNYDARGEIQLLSGHYPTFKPSINVQLPTNSNSNVITSTITSDTPTRQLSAHHTAQFFFNDFTGSIMVQGTLDSLPPNGNTSGNVSLSWATISSIGYADQTVTDYHNWDGVYTACRFIVTPANASPLSGNVSAILYRS
jgi:hypothetical protein